MSEPKFIPKTTRLLLSRWDTEKETGDEPTASSRKMVELGIYPSDWATSREREAGLYPDIEDPEFQRKIYYKKEFYDARAEAFSSLQQKGDQCSLAAFEAFTLTPVQRAVSRFMNPNTPYHGLLLYHGVGVGKTCSAISIAENFLAERPRKRVHIIAPRSIAPGFKKTIFNPALLRRAKQDDPARYVKNGWYSAQCTGTTYLGLVNAMPEEEESKILYRIEAMKRRRYRISGYMAFKLAVDKLYKTIPNTITDLNEIKERKREILRENFNNGLIIIDEAHNLRHDTKITETSSDSDEIAPDESPDVAAAEDAAEAKAIVPLLLDIAAYCEGVRLVLMTATPMYNTATEILFLLNLLILNDTKRMDEFTNDKIFDSKGIVKPEGEEALQKIASRYVSYMRGENPYTFPVRLRPQEAAEFKNSSDIRDFQSRAVDFTREISYPTKTALRGGEDISESLNSEIIEGLSALPIQLIRPIEGSICDKILRYQMDIGNEENKEEMETVIGKGNKLDTWTQIGNLTYPNQQYGKAGWRTHFHEEGKQIQWKLEDYSIDDVFGEAALPNHGPKIAKIIDTIRTSRGINFIYSRFVQPGALLVAVALERAGYTRVNYDGVAMPLLRGAPPVAKQCALCPRKQHGPTEDCPVFRPACYVLLTTDYTTNLGETINYATSFPNKEAVRGGNVKVIVGSQIASEGLDLKCVREIHVLDPWYHLNRTEQIIGRGVRYCSHSLLPAEERNCIIRLYATFYDDVETSDLYSYRIAITKAKAIGIVQRQLKIGAWDCNLNYQGILLSGDIRQKHIDAQGNDLGEVILTDKENSGMCDYMECSYKCRLSVGTVSEDEKELNTSTFTVRDARAFMLLRESALRQMFSLSPFWPLQQVREIYKGLPDDILSAALPLIINNPSFEIKFNGQTGFLVLRNNYVVFQPKDITETSIPMALRYKRSTEDGGPLWLRHFKPASSLFKGEQSLPARKTTTLGSIELEESPLMATPTTASSGPASVSTGTDSTAGTAITRTKVSNSKITSIAERPAIWADIINKSLESESPQILRLTPELKLRMKGLDELGIIANRFRDLPQTKDVLLSFGLDHFYGSSTREALLTAAVKGTLTGENITLYAPSLKRDIFEDPSLKGYFLLDSSSHKLLTYCIRPGSGSSDIAQCPSSLVSYVEAAAATSGLAPIGDIAAICGTAFGILVHKPGQEHPTFKTVENSIAGATTEGAECSGVSNKTPHLAKIKKLREAAEKSDQILFQAMYPLTEKAEGETKAAATRKTTIVDTNDMKQSTLCLYLEFLCRIMDARRVAGKRWFLNAVETKRSMDAPGSMWPRKR